MTNSDATSTKHSDAPNSCGRSSVAAGALVRVITVYQRLTSGRPSPCRFYPSCSNYALEAVAVHGAWRGLWLAVRRISRCRPLGPHGIDLVPETRRTTRSLK